MSHQAQGCFGPYCQLPDYCPKSGKCARIEHLDILPSEATMLLIEGNTNTPNVIYGENGKPLIEVRNVSGGPIYVTAAAKGAR